MEDAADDVTLFDALRSTALLPFRTLTSPTARRTYVRTALLSLAALFLAALAVAAYTAFYFAYIPQLGFTRPVHLEFEPASAFLLQHDAPPGFPSGELDIRKGELVTGQAYDVRVRLHMPRAPVNLDAGNFMIDLHLLGGPDTTGSASKIARSLKGNDALKTVASARRPAILKYVSPLVERATKIATIVLYAAGWRDDAEWLDVQLFDAVSFTYRADVPLRARVELRSAHRLWVYDCAVDFRARFAGLRWLMYNHRIISFVIFTSLFWVIEMITALVFWFGSSFLFAKAGANELDARGVGRSKRGGQSVTQDEDEGTVTEGLSDASRQFPTFSRQPPLRYSSPRVKSEDEAVLIKREHDEEDNDGPMAGRAVEADDEDEDEDEDADFVVEEIGGPTGEGRSDSGLGTSMESSAGGSASVRRRKSQRGF